MCANTEKTHTVLAGYAERKKGTLLFKGKTESPELRNTREEKLNSSFTAEDHRSKKKKGQAERGGETVNKEKQGSKVM